MATGGFRSGATTDFLEEWKAKREKMRAKMLGDIAASTGHGALTAVGRTETRGAAPNVELTAGGGAERCGPGRRPEDEQPSAPSPPPPPPPQQQQQQQQAPPGRMVEPPGGSLKKAAAPVTPPSDGDRDGKSKEKKSAGPSARKGKGQIEKRKLREKRRSTGVVSIPSNESLDELDDDDDGSQKERKREDAITQHNTAHNESMSSDLGTGTNPLLLVGEASVTGSLCVSAGPAQEDDGGTSSRHRQGYGRQGPGPLDRRIEELEKELAAERQENARLQKVQQEKEELIVKLKEEIDLLYRDLDDIEDENEQLKQENKTLLKVVGQLTSQLAAVERGAAPCTSVCQAKGSLRSHADVKGYSSKVRNGRNRQYK
ncbi:PRKC apoptosis WT1 regulator protein-like [Arapaima gigas]